MKISKAKDKAIISFRINGIRESEGDESKKFIEFVNNLTANFIPHNTFRYCFIDRESDDCYWNVTFDKLFIDIIKNWRWV